MIKQNFADQLKAQSDVWTSQVKAAHTTLQLFETALPRQSLIRDVANENKSRRSQQNGRRGAV
jgi:hypothetical protein